MPQPENPSLVNHQNKPSLINPPPPPPQQSSSPSINPTPTPIVANDTCSNSSFNHEDDTSLLSSPNSSMQASSPPPRHLASSSIRDNNNNADVFLKLFQLGTEPERKKIFERLQIVWDEYAIQCRNLTNISKHPFDLFKLYNSVREKGGFNDVTRL